MGSVPDVLFLSTTLINPAFQNKLSPIGGCPFFPTTSLSPSQVRKQGRWGFEDVAFLLGWCLAQAPPTQNICSFTMHIVAGVASLNTCNGKKILRIYWKKQIQPFPYRRVSPPSRNGLNKKCGW